MPTRLFRQTVSLPASALHARLSALERECEIERRGGAVEKEGLEILRTGWDRHLFGPSGAPELARFFWDRILIERCELSARWRCRVVYGTPRQLGLHVVLSGMGLTELFSGSVTDLPRFLLVLGFLNLVPVVSSVAALREFCRRLHMPGAESETSKQYE